MANMSLEKNKMPEQAPDKRNKNFEEVAFGYNEEAAVDEAKRCLGCKNRPCVAGCPVNVQIPEFIAEIAEGKFREGYKKITETNALPAICGRVCPQETQCEQLCVRGKKGEPVGIGRLERFAADWYMKNVAEEAEKPSSNGKAVAVIGAGPSGLTCAGDLAKKGYDVTIFEAFHTAGGVLVYGIPEFRLPKEIVKKEIDALEKMGVKIMTDMVMGRVLSLDELFEMGFMAVYVATGAGLPTFMGIEGERLLGVYSANEFLTRVNLMKAYLDDYDTPIKKGGSVAVVGGGNVAMDAARCAKRLGAGTVYIVYRRSEAEMPARLEEVHHAKEEGIIFKLLINPVRIIGDEKGFVTGIECVEMELGEPDESGRRRPVPKKGSELVLDVDSVVMAIGTSPNPIIAQTSAGIETNRKGCIVADDDMKTTREGVYAGGDAVKGAATVIYAMGTGKKAAESIDEYLRGK